MKIKKIKKNQAINNTWYWNKDKMFNYELSYSIILAKKIFFRNKNIIQHMKTDVYIFQ